MVSGLFTGRLVEKPQFILAKYPTQIFCVDHCSMRKFTSNQHSKLANTKCMLYLMVNLGKNLNAS